MSLFHPTHSIPRYLAILVVTASMVAVAASGCRSRTGAGVNTAQLDPANQNALRYVVTDRGVDRVAEVVEARQAFDRGTTPQVQVKVRNRTNDTQRFAYRWIWTDSGFEVDTAKSIDRVQTIKGGEVLTLRGVAPTAEVDGWQLKLSEVD